MEFDMVQISDAIPEIVSATQWQEASKRLLAKEKALTRARDALAAERRRLPMTKIEKAYIFEGAEEQVSLVDLFDGRPQLLLYHFMFAPAVHGWRTAGCPGCSMFTDNIGQFTTEHLKARGVALALCPSRPSRTSKPIGGAWGGRIGGYRARTPASIRISG
jgi:predicted dithiol-disulfide oxidoreductase (DUF899 family)